MLGSEVSERPHLEHPALLYGSTEDFLSFMVPYVCAGLDNREMVFVAARGNNLAALRDAVGSGGAAVQWQDTEAWHPHAGTRLRAFHQLASDSAAGGATSIRLAGEPLWPAGPPELVREWQRYESVLNHVLDPFPVTLVCLYDAARLDPSILAVARRTHPDVHQETSSGPSVDFEPPEEFLAGWNSNLSPAPPGADRLPEIPDLSSARRYLLEQALRAGLPPERAMDLCVAGNEALSNALVHGRGATGLWTWVEDGRFICQVEDDGPGVADPLAGYRPPSRDAGSGRGLWLSRQLVDLVQIAPATSRGTRVRFQVKLAAD